MKHRTARGTLIDMAALSAQNADQVAIGNARMNARGDLLGEHGVILKTQEQIEAEWAAERERSASGQYASEDLKAPLEQMIAPVGAGKKQPHLMVDKDFEVDMIEDPNVEMPKPSINKTTRRKIVDSE